jgi:hypothetical protein
MNEFIQLNSRKLKEKHTATNNACAHLGASDAKLVMRQNAHIKIRTINIRKKEI